MNILKKAGTMAMITALSFSVLTGCGQAANTEQTPAQTGAENTSASTAGGAENGQSEGTGEKQTEGGSAAGSGSVYGITYWCESDFFKTVADSITEEATAAGSKTVVVDAQQDATKQIQIIEDFIAQGVKAVFLNPVDKDAIEPALQKLDAAGIPVINFDSSVANLDLVDAYVATDNYLAGQLCAQAMMSDLPDGGKIAILNYPANNACNDREKGFMDTISDKFEVVATFDAEGTVEKGQNITSDIIQAHPDIAAVFSINDQAGMGAFAAMTTAGKDAYIYGVDGAPEAKQAISKKGIYRMTAAQSPISIGKECYQAAVTILEGKELESFQIDVPAFSIDFSNIEEYLNADWQ